MQPIIRVENLSKQYRLGNIGTGTLSHDLKRWYYQARGWEDPYSTIGEINDRSTKGSSEYVWALKDINFEVMPGEILGIIGKNGAGKSTLLKILSKVTGPTTGGIYYNGRIGALLEVGTGFHPELTGRENIFLNGAILGMTKAEIKSKLDEIIDFSGVERYIDTPVKRYSSGMMVRLGFAVAAHLEPEILIVDEVLAVGDAEFQKKAIGKMQDVSKNDGRTVLFVSHNMTAMENLSDKICIIAQGQLNYLGDASLGIKKYLDDLISDEVFDIQSKLKTLQVNEYFEFYDFTIKQDSVTDHFLTNKPLQIVYKYKVKKNILGLRVGFDLISGDTHTVIFRSFHDDQLSNIEVVKAGHYENKAEIFSDFLLEGNYILSASIGIHNVQWIIFDEVKIRFTIHNINGINKIYADKRPGVINPLINWSYLK